MYIPEDPASEPSCTEDSDILEDQFAMVDWHFVRVHAKISTAFKIADKKLKHCKVKLAAFKKEFGSELMLVKALVDANIKKFSKKQKIAKS